MNEKFVKKCNKVFETSKTITGNKELLEAVECKLLQESFSENYLYLISYYAGVFLKNQ